MMMALYGKIYNTVIHTMKQKLMDSDIQIPENYLLKEIVIHLREGNIPMNTGTLAIQTLFPNHK